MTLNRRKFIRKGAKAGVGLLLAGTPGCKFFDIFTPRQSLDDFIDKYTPLVEDLASNKQEPSQFLYENMISDAQQVSLDYPREEGEKVKYSEPRLASDPVRGDLNGDGKANIFDLLEVLKALRDPNPPAAADLDGNEVVNIFDVLEMLKIMSGFYTSYLIKGQHFDNDTEQGTRARISIDNKTFFTNYNGVFSTRVPKKKEYVLTAQQVGQDGNLTGYTRTINLPGIDTTDLNILSVSYPTQENVTPELFKALCEEGNFLNLVGYTGLKTFFGNPNAQFWISSHHHTDDARSNTEEQNHVKNLIETEIYPYLKQEHRFPIHIENPDNIEVLPYHQKGVILIMPENNPQYGFGISPIDIDYDGVIDWASVYFPQGRWDWDAGILEETLSALVASGEVLSDKFRNLTVLSSNSYLTYLTQMDKKLIRICENYKPKKQIDNILGM